MLRIYLAEKDIEAGKEIVWNVEKEFFRLTIKGTQTDRQLIRDIEKGEYKNEEQYIDRFGSLLSYDDMSTGCMAALCVANTPDKVISLAECGLNARDAIVRNCRDGAILMEDNGITIVSIPKVEIAVAIDEKEFSDIDELNRYINCYRFMR